jgi:hypothetical protein
MYSSLLLLLIVVTILCFSFCGFGLVYGLGFRVWLGLGLNPIGRRSGEEHKE